MRQLKITKLIPPSGNQILKVYFKEIGREDLLSEEEEVLLAQRIRKGDRAANDKFVRANLRFVVSVAKQYQHQGLPLPDLISEGNLGLIKAAEKYDENRGFRFTTYAGWWIRQSILQALSEQSRIVQLPINQVGSLYKINRAISRFEQENERRPSVDELAYELGMESDKIANTIKISGRSISVDIPVVEREDNSLHEASADNKQVTYNSNLGILLNQERQMMYNTVIDILVKDKSMMPDIYLCKESFNLEVERALSALLAERECDILKMFFGIGQEEMDLDEIGKKFGIGRERVRQIKEKAICSLRNNSKNKLLRSYL